jgi:hypothetical protein
MAAQGKSLRAVGAGESAPPRKPMTVLEASESGDYLAELRALRRRIATAVSDLDTPARDLAALTRRQLEISKEIKSIVSADLGDDIGDAADIPDEDWVAN